MAENKKSFIAYVDWKETFDSLPDDKAGQLVKHLFSYVSDENPTTDDILINAVFANIKQQLKRDLRKWESLSVQRAEFGRLGGIKSGVKRSKRSKSLKNEAKASKGKQNEHVTVNVNDTVNDNEEIRINKSWIRWNDFKKAEFNFKYKSDISENAAKKELLELSGGDEETAIKIIEQSIAKGWKGFFELKNNGNGSNKKSVGASDEAVARIIAENFGIDAPK